ncbi:MAG: LuxR C-terminal-related transcriptional regulator [Bacteroidota bacterium]|nr:LuxR C-terminal-related transcriptional regulator [Bacteroidota bacterium]MDP4234444.1 LuxR C-terminal-related transcriptional regulator [Bacteroidota bacterium]MDP4243974.1 LuxR C-terminal-related transcriptional regulator [Bacteroidota bacterium]MDP4288176.1 LuxR C-terminal-related transcriptional regulator [Bacteroidota bacterium]
MKILKLNLTPMQTQCLNELRGEYPMLSEVELRIMTFVACGLGDREIAELCGCSLRTIENSRYRIGKKLSPNTSSQPGTNGRGPGSERVISPQPRSAHALSPKPGHTSGIQGQRMIPASHRSSAQDGRSSGRWLLPGVLFQTIDLANEPWV